MIEISSKKYTRSAKSVVYLGGVRQYFINRILSDIYIQIKIKSPAQYKIGIARLYNKIIKVVATIPLYLSAISITGPVYRSSYSDCTILFVLASLQENPLSLHLLHSAYNQNNNWVKGIIILKKTVRQIVAPTFLYQSASKSLNLPVKIGKCSGKLTTSVQLAFSRSKITAVDRNYTTHNFVSVLLSI